MEFARHTWDLTPSDIRRWTAIIEARDGVNLAQGNCFIEPLSTFDDLKREVSEAIERGRLETGFNTYTSASGVPILREAVARKATEFNRIPTDPDQFSGNVVITAGATGAMALALDALIDPGDEVITFEPFYNYHLKALQMRGGVPRYVTIRPPHWAFTREDLESVMTPGRTKAIIVTNPGNPSGKVFSPSELQMIVDFAVAQDIVIISDEVYEFITFDGHVHTSIASLPGAAERTITLGAYSKTLAITGWRIGYTIASPEITARLRVINEMTYVCAPSVLQHAIGHVAMNWRRFLELGPLFQAKRDTLLAGLAAAGLNATVPQGAYYTLTDISFLGLPDATTANMHLVEKYGIAGVPGPAFYANDFGRRLIRFCFAHTDADLTRAQDSLTRATARP